VYVPERGTQLIGLLEVSPQEFRDPFAADSYLVGASAKEQHVIVVTEGSGIRIGIFTTVCGRPLLECRDDLLLGFRWGSHVRILAGLSNHRNREMAGSIENELPDPACRF
jgi:hypothetical protein